MIPFRSSSTEATTSRNLPPLLLPPRTDRDFLPSLEILSKSANAGDRDAYSTVAASHAARRRSTKISPRKPFRRSSKRSCDAFVEKKYVFASTLNLRSIPLSPPETISPVFTSTAATRDNLNFFELGEEREQSVFFHAFIPLG
jgi:hypothetical protein